MTVLLLRMTYYPESSRFSLEDPALVMDRLLSRVGSDYRLDIWKGNDLIGALDVQPVALPLTQQKLLNAAGRLILTLQLDVPLLGMAPTKLVLNGNLALGLDSEIKESHFTLDFPDFQQLKLTIDDPHLAPQPHLKLTQGSANAILFDSNDLAASGSSQSLVDLMLGAFQMDAKSLKQAATAASISSTEARRGAFTVADREFNGYVLTTTLGGSGDRKFILSISDSGEIVQMVTNFLDYRFISDGLRPEGVNGYEKQVIKNLNLPGPPPTPLPK